jgi:hypothetical protein
MKYNPVVRLEVGETIVLGELVTWLAETACELASRAIRTVSLPDSAIDEAASLAQDLAEPNGFAVRPSHRLEQADLELVQDHLKTT